jgi:penicillin-binding protein 1C
MSGGTKHPAFSILSPVASYMITDILTKVNRPDFPLNWAATEHMPKIAWKTGTSYGRRDAWSIGYNKRYTVGVWVGNFSGTGVQELSGANTASPLLFKIFNTIDYQNDGDWFSAPEGIDWRQVCSETGLPPGPNCTNLVLDAFIPLTSSTTSCTHLQEIKVSIDGSVSYCAGCAPKAGYLKKRYTVPLADLLEFYKGNRAAPEAIPPHYSGCETIFKGDGPRIVSPLEGSEYYISKKEREPIRLSAAAAADVTTVYWYVNDVFYSSAPPNAKLFYMPADGPQKISCTDDKGRNRNVTITVKWVDL